jgi:hypothetical protein
MQQSYKLGPFCYFYCSAGSTHNTMKHHVGAHKYKTSYLFYGNNISPQKNIDKISNHLDAMKKIKPLPTWQPNFIDKWKPKT